MKKTISALSSALVLAGCASAPPVSNHILEDDLHANKKGIVGSRDYLPIEYQSVKGENYFKLESARKGEKIPDVDIPSFSVSGASVQDSLDLLLAGTDINFVMHHDIGSQEGIYLRYRRGKLSNIVDDITESANLLYEYRNNTLHFMQRNRMSFRIPPVIVDGRADQIKSALESLGAEDVTIDSHFNVVSLSSDRRSLSKIQEYLKEIQNKGAVIVYDTWIWEVSLNNSSQSGINWENINYSGNDYNINLTGGSGISSDASGVLGAFTNTASSRLSISGLVRFMSDHGSLKTISQPKISLLSGSQAILEVGEEMGYISELTSTLSGDVTQTTIETDILTTGLRLSLSGAYDNETVFSKIDLSVIELMRFNEYASGDTSISLPHTMNRRIETDTRIVPGEYFILGGVNMTRSNDKISGLPGAGNTISLPFYRGKDEDKSELVIVMRPRVVVFKEKPETGENQ